MTPIPPWAAKSSKHWEHLSPTIIYEKIKDNNYYHFREIHKFHFFRKLKFDDLKHKNEVNAEKSDKITRKSGKFNVLLQIKVHYLQTCPEEVWGHKENVHHSTLLDKRFHIPHGFRGQ